MKLPDQVTPKNAVIAALVTALLSSSGLASFTSYDIHDQVASNTQYIKDNRAEKIRWAKHQITRLETKATYSKLTKEDELDLKYWKREYDELTKRGG